MDFAFSKEEVAIDEGLGNPKLCRNPGPGLYSHGPPFTSTPHILQQHEALSARELDHIFPIIDPKAKPTTNHKVMVNSSNSSHMEGFSIDRPPFFFRNDYFY
ncbi:uncharacterized protein LOC100256639 [Vitis vinifera]|uniref:uncharacterized protein LOC100256639 n=1 Tax=Vitis vinifera TaxID=29760 RepID=UPI0001984108|nr:uncharacterized protein LOC100256639 [Vitis vinifera]|eukprot:XP_002285218.1 PREDICTED: uncharacterized protein LOC100256639 [Vitis vinifera]